MSRAQLVAVVVAAALALAAVALPATAQDSVKVRYVPSYPPPNQSSEPVQLAVSRIAAAVPGREEDVDRYFAEVRRLVADGGVPARWGAVTPDAAWVELEITLGERKYVLANTHGPGGLKLQPDATAADRRVAAAFQRVLDLTLLRIRSRLSTPP